MMCPSMAVVTIFWVKFGKSCEMTVHAKRLLGLHSISMNHNRTPLLTGLIGSGLSSRLGPTQRLGRKNAGTIF